jgi:hypothetical protein
VEHNKSIISTQKEGGVKHVVLSKLAQVIAENGGILTPTSVFPYSILITPP